MAHVRGLVEAGDLAPDEPVTVLEVGSGLGAFAQNFIDALAHGCGEEGRALAGRLRYLLSDASEKSLAEATAQPGLARLVASGTVVPLRFDLTDPTALALPRPPRGGRRAKGAKGAGGELVAVICNYICCITPLKVLRFAGRALLEKHVRLTVEVADAAEARRVAGELATLGAPGALPRKELVERLEAATAWRPLDLRALPGAHHRALVADLRARLGPATLNYPHVFLDLLRGLRPRLRRGGLMLVCDFGSPERAEVQAPTSDRAAWHYGLSLAHDVDFVVFDAFAAREGLGLVRTRNGLLDLHTVGLLARPDVPPAFAEAFAATHVRREGGQELLDLTAAAAVSYEAGRHAEAARLYAQCLRRAPRSPHVLHRYGQACLAANLQGQTSLRRLARRLRLGRRLDVTGKLDFDTILAGVHLRLDEPARARRLLEASLARGETAAKHAALAETLERLGEREAAYAAHLRALALEPEGEPAALAMERLVRGYLLGPDAPVRWVGPPARRRRAEGRRASGGRR